MTARIINLKKFLLWISVYSIAFAFVESAVVVYLREIYYPDGFKFPLKVIADTLYITELAREFATIVMLAAPAFLIGKNLAERFAYFIYSFGVWDIFFYLWLKVILGWPESIFTWDILFLLPVAWAGPVITPLICSLTMIILALCILTAAVRKENIFIESREWLLIFSGAFVIVLSFTHDIIKLALSYGSSRIQEYGSFRSYLETYTPSEFSWLIFIAGEGLIILATGLFSMRNFRSKPEN